MRRDIKPANWDSAAAIVINAICDMTGSHEYSTLPDELACQEAVEMRFDDIVENVFQGDSDPEVIEEQFFDLAIAAICGYAFTANVSHQKAASLIYETVVGKQKMYGHGNIARFEIPGVVIRTNDKLERLKNLRKHKGPVLFEPLEDTWLDICGYSLIAIMWVRGWFLLNLKNQETTANSGE